MLTCLRHHAGVGRNHEQTEIDSARSDEHAAHEILVAGNIDHTNGADTIQLERGETQIDCDAAPLFFGQAIGVDSGQCFYECGLSVIDMAGRADDHAALHRSCSHTANARRGRSSLR